MPKPHRKRRIAPALRKIIDATPERIAKDPEGHEWVNAAEIDPAEQGINRVRRFRDTMLDRLHRREKLTLAQWTAGDLYRRTHDAATSEPSVCASYGERTSAGEVGYGLPRTEGQIKARQRLRDMRDQFPREMQGFMDRFLVRDALPRYGGRAHFRQVSEIRSALDELAMFLAGGVR